MAQPFVVFGRNYFRNFPSDRSQERNTGASSAILQGKKKKKLIANVAARRKAKEFSLDNFLFCRNSLAEVFSPLNRQLRKLFWAGSWLLLHGCCHITQLIKSHTTMLQMTGPEKRLNNEQQVTDTAVEPPVMLSNCKQADKTLNLLADYLLCQEKRLNSLENFQSNTFPTENSTLYSCCFVIEIC